MSSGCNTSSPQMLVGVAGSSKLNCRHLHPFETMKTTTRTTVIPAQPSLSALRKGHDHRPLASVLRAKRFISSRTCGPDSRRIGHVLIPYLGGLDDRVGPCTGPYMEGREGFPGPGYVLRVRIHNSES